MVLEFCTDVSPAEWITGSSMPWYDLAVFGPAGFDAYARLRFIPDPAFDGQRSNDVQFDYNDLSDGDMVAQACAVLASETGTLDECYFALWEGWPDVEHMVSGKPQMEIPARSYYLFRGTVTDVDNWGETAPRDLGPAAFIWPADQAWCIASDVDPHWAGIGASSHAITRLTAHPVLDIVPANYAEGVPNYY